MARQPRGKLDFIDAQRRPDRKPVAMRVQSHDESKMSPSVIQSQEDNARGTALLGRNIATAAAPPATPTTDDMWFNGDTTTNCPDNNCTGHTLDANGVPNVGAYPHRKLLWPHRYDGSAWKDGLGIQSVAKSDIVDSAVIQQKIANAAVAASKLALSDLVNLCGNPHGDFYDTGSGIATDWNLISADKASFDGTLPAGARGLAQAGRDGYYGKWFPCAAGDQFFVSSDHYTVGCNYAASVGLAFSTNQGEGGVFDWRTAGSAAPNTAGKQSISGTITAPANARYACVWSQIDGFAGFGTNYFRNVKVYRKATSDLIVDGAVIAAKIAAGAVVADKVAAGVITAKNLTVVDFDNLWPNASSEVAPPAGADTTTAEWAWRTASGSAYSGGYVREGVAGGSQVQLQKNDSQAKPGDKFYLQAYLKQTAGASGGFLLVAALDQNGNITGGAALNTDFWVSSTVASGTWTLASIATGALPATTCYVRFALVVNANTTIHFDAIYARRMAGSELIVDGAILATKIAAGAVETDKLAANAVTAAKIAAHTITANEIAADTITAAEIAAGTVTAAELAGASIATSDYAYTGTIDTSNEVATTGARMRNNQSPGSSLPAILTGPNGMKVGSYIMGVVAVASMSALARSGTAATDVVWYRGNNTGNPILVDPVWARSTAYAVGDRVVSSPYDATTYPCTNYGPASGASGKFVYVCTTAGTSASTGLGPSGTTFANDSITDGTAKWKWYGWMWPSFTFGVGTANLVSPWKRSIAYSVGAVVLADPWTTAANSYPAAFAGGEGAALYNLPFAAVNTNTAQPGARSMYRCSQAGTSAATGLGPSGTGTNIVDNTARWDYIGNFNGPEERLTVFCPIIHAPSATYDDFDMEFRLQPKTNKDNLDALRYLYVEYYGDASGTPADQYDTNYHTPRVYPIPDRAYYAGLATSPDYIYNRTVVTGHWSGGTRHNATAPNGAQLYLRVYVHWAQGYLYRDFTYLGNYRPTPFYGGISTFSAPGGGGGGGGDGGGGYCVAPETGVLMADGHFRPAGLLQKDDRVWTVPGGPSRQTEPGEYTVTNVETVDVPERVALTFSDGTRLVCTPRHPLMTGSGWLGAEGLRSGDRVLSVKDGTLRVESVLPLPAGKVVRITVDAATYITEGGILNHNMKAQ